MSPNSQYIITEVLDTLKIKEFNEFPSQLYKEDSNWIRPLDVSVEEIFDKKANKNLLNGDITRWIIKDNNGICVGRIAAFYTEESFRQFDQPTGGIGFFDSINREEVAFKLFDVAKEWLQSKKLEAMDGPSNPGMRDAFWGCLAEGFHEPVFNMPYNFPYYKNLFEAYGFRDYFKQYTYQRTFEDTSDLHPAVLRTANRILSNSDYEFKLIEKGNLKFALDFKEIYNKAWSKFTGTNEINDQEALSLLKSMEPIMDERLIIYGYYKGEPIAFFIMMPDIGQITRKFNGNFNWFNKLRFLWNLKVMHSVDRVIGRIFGVIPEYQNKGVEGALILFFQKQISKPNFKYKTFELNWIGDFNPVMMKVAEFIGGSIYKTHITYRYLFDRKAEFRRAPLVNQSGS
ncbi:MAG TPA: hypothetical protein VIK10_01275 [Prolixibacteraceae bacterium]